MRRRLAVRLRSWRDAKAGSHRGHVRLRLRYGGTLSPWWEQLNVPPEDVDGLVRGTGLQLELHERDGEDHVVVLRLAEGGDVG